jgi:hypothetical protein
MLSKATPQPLSSRFSGEGGGREMVVFYPQNNYHIYGPHLCEDIRLYPDGNLNASVCLLPSFLITVSLKRLIIDGASIVMSMLNT